MLILTDNMLWWGALGSIINLAIITIERYLKVVHSNWSKTKLRKWMIYLAMAFAWIVAIIYTNMILFITSTVIKGVCYNMMYKGNFGKILSLIGISIYFAILFTFVLCYWRILLVVRRQAKIMSGHTAAGSNAPQVPQPQMNHIQINLTKTVILVCVYYAVMWLPIQISHLIMVLSTHPDKYLVSGYYATLFISFLYICTNPFIYATKFDPVKEVLLRLIPCKKTSGQAAQNVN